MQGQVAEARRAQEASTESIMTMLKKLVPADDAKDDDNAKASARSAARRTGSDSPAGARGHSRSLDERVAKERKLAEKTAKAAKEGSRGTD